MPAAEASELHELRQQIHDLDIKIERLIVLMETFQARDVETEKRLTEVERQVRENTQALTIVKWAGGIAATIASAIGIYLLNSGLELLSRLAQLAR